LADAMVAQARNVLQSTPAVLQSLLGSLSASWLHATDGPGTWSPTQVLLHLIGCEREVWIPRAERILEHDPSPFAPFTRDSGFDRAEHESIDVFLREFAALRAQSLKALDDHALSASDLDRQGTHPDFGAVTLRQLLATWTAHDLAHTSQIVRTMARQYRDLVGPWRQYMRVLD